MVETFATDKEMVQPERTEMQARIRPESPRPGRLAVGRGNAVVLWGSCFHRRESMPEL